MAKQSTNKTAVKKGNLFRGLGRKLEKITKDELRAPCGTPGVYNLYVFKQHPKRPNFVIEEKTSLPFPASATIEHPKDAIPFKDNPAFKTSDSTYLIGYDIEFQENPPDHPDGPATLLSHQWYFNFAGLRFGVILLTDQTLSTQLFIDILKKAVPCVADKKLNKVYVYAYFSLVECGWMHPSMKITKKGTDFFGKEINKIVPLIAERGKQWHKCVELRTQTRPKKKGDGDISWKVMLEFSDAMNLSGGGSLKSFGEMIGIKKLDIGDNIKKMEKFKATDLLTFCLYGINDSVIAAEAHNWYVNQSHRAGLKKPRNRTALYSSDLFKDIFIDIYGNKHWKRFIGYEKSATSNSWKLTPTHISFTRFYHGGRNEALRVGPHGKATYHDLRSAYPTAIIMLPDYDLSCSQVYYGTEAAVNANLMQQDGPFQIAGVMCSYSFKDSVQPIFPERIDEPESVPNYSKHFTVDGLIFPKSGEAYVTWPEFWVAINMNLLETHTIISLVTFTKLGTYELSQEFYKLLEMRGTNDKALSAFYKQILNYAYGKLAQGVSDAADALKKHDLTKKIATSPVTCLPLAAYITGFCRAVIGELLQQNPDCYAITTDGFISPRSKLETSNCVMCTLVEEKVGGLSPFIGIETKNDIQAIGDRSLFIKTRGYLIVNGDNEYRKIARMGAQLPDNANQVEYVKNFLDYLTTGRFNKTFTRSLVTQRKKWRNDMKARNLKNSEAQVHREKLIKGTTTAKNQDNELQKAISNAWKKGKLTVLKSSLPLDVIYNDVRLNQTYDMKRIPLKPTLKPFTWGGKDYNFVSFETKPLNTSHDFHMLRSLSKRDRDRYREEHKSDLEQIHALHYGESVELNLDDAYTAICKSRDNFTGEHQKFIDEVLVDLRADLDLIELNEKNNPDKIKQIQSKQKTTLATFPPEPPFVNVHELIIPDDETLLEAMAFIGMIPKEVPYLELADYKKLAEEFARLETGHESEDPRIEEELVLERRTAHIVDSAPTASQYPALPSTSETICLETEEQYLVRLVKIRDGITKNSRQIRLKAKEHLNEYAVKLTAVRDDEGNPKQIRRKAARLLAKITPNPSDGIVAITPHEKKKTTKKKQQPKKKAASVSKYPVTRTT